MTHEEVVEMLEEADLPLAYDHFAEGEAPDPPFICLSGLGNSLSPNFRSFFDYFFSLPPNSGRGNLNFL